MAILFDSNVWVALTFSAHPHHSLALREFATATAGNPVCFCRSTQQSFLRLATTPALLRAYAAEGFTNRDALSVVDSLSKLPTVKLLAEPTDLESAWHRIANLPSASPKVWMDAYLAAFAIGHDAEFVTLDKDFQSLVKHGLKLRLLSP